MSKSQPTTTPELTSDKTAAEAHDFPDDFTGSTLSYGQLYLMGIFALIGMIVGVIGLYSSIAVMSILGFLLLSLVGAVLGWRLTQLDQALAEKTGLLLQSFQGSSTARMIENASGEIVFYNDTYADLIPKRSQKRNFEDFVAFFGEDNRIDEAINSLRSKARQGRFASVVLTPDSQKSESRKWLLIDAMPLKDWDHHVHWRIEDVTERADVERRIRQERARVNDFMQNAPVGFFSVDADGSFRLVNATFAQLLGLREDELMSGNYKLHDFLHDKPNTEPYFLFEGEEKDQHGELTILSMDGRIFQAEVTHSIVGQGSDLRTHSIIRDLSAEQEWRAAFQASERRFKRFFEFSPIGIALVDLDSRVSECNQAFLGMCGSEDGSDILQKPIFDFIEDVQGGDLTEKFADAREKDINVAPFEAKLVGKKQEASVQIYTKRLIERDGAPAILMLHFIDLTELKNLEMQFAQSQKMQAVGQLAGGVAHDFNNLLTAMIGFCDLLLMRHKPGDPSFGDIMQIKQNANRASNLVKQLLAFSRQQTLTPKILSVTDVLAELSNLIRRLIGEPIHLEMQHGRDIGLVKVDQGQLEQVILNLAVNARDAMAEGGGGQLVISTRKLVNKEDIRREHEIMPKGEYVVIEVKDTGTGIPAEIIERIFEPFFSTKDIGAGTGLGLSTVYGIVRQTGGFIFVDSVVGSGTTFTICLPRYEQKAEDTQQAISGVPVSRHVDLTGTESILLVEDEEPVRIFSGRALRNKGYKVLEASDGEAALDIINKGEEKIDLLITDVVMPNMDGPTLYTEVKKRGMGDLKVIFISGYSDDRFADKLDDKDKFYFLPKPFSLKQLATKVKEVMNDK